MINIWWFNLANGNDWDEKGENFPLTYFDYYNAIKTN